MFIIVHGYEGSGEEHWQSWLLRQLQQRGAAAVMPDLPDPLAPQKDAWVGAMPSAQEAGAALSNGRLARQSDFVQPLVMGSPLVSYDPGRIRTTHPKAKSESR